VFSPEGDSSATITSNRMLYFDRDGRFEAYDSVVVVTPEGKRLTTEHLTWTQNDRMLRTRRFVRIVTPSEVVQGNGLVAEEDLDTYQIGRFTARVEVDDEEDAE
jgi:LPS export ABC transporter protein LptC